MPDTTQPAKLAELVGVKPGHGKAGRHPTREFLNTLSGRREDPGMFGRMFPDLPPLAVPDAALQALANAMKDANPGDPAGDNPNIPAGFTYLGQFVDHDITLDLTSIGEKAKDPFATENFRTPSLDLDSIYGLGPDGSPHLYARNAANGNAPGPKLLIGTTVKAFQDFGNVPAGLPNDLPRNPQGFALVGDHRNDENLLVAQTHLAILKFHNKVVDALAGRPKPPPDLFFEARRLVTWHYQWLVLHDFVERITEEGIVGRILREGRKFYCFKRIPFMPVEFSAAAYRLGHSMVREVYSHNRIFTPPASPQTVPATLALLFSFSGLSGGIVGDLAPDPLTAPTPISLLPSNWIIDWRRFYELNTPPQPGIPLNSSRKIDPFLVPALHELPGGAGSLAFRNLRRGVILGLPSGQDVARAMDIEPLTAKEIATGPDGKVAQQQGLHEATPLWYYILKEAQVRSGGERLGPVGARIVAEVFVGLVEGDSESFLRVDGNAWKPTLPGKVKGKFTMADLLQFVGDISPIDGVTT
jgi:hypothetical protein